VRAGEARGLGGAERLEGAMTLAGAGELVQAKGWGRAWPSRGAR
jgi:hypothetical protein